MRIDISVEQCGDEPSLCKGYLECHRDDGQVFSMATGRCRSNEGALRELLDVVNAAAKNIRFNLKAIERSKAKGAGK